MSGTELAAVADPEGLTSPVARWQQKNALVRQIAKGVGYQTAANLASQASSFLCLLIAARLLGKEQYGRFALVQTTVNTFVTVAALGLGITATKYVSEYRTNDPKRAGRILGLSSAVAASAAILFSVAYYFACPSLVGAGYSAPMRIGAICIFFTTLNGYQLGALSGFEVFRIIARIALWAALLNPVATATLTFSFGFAGAVTSLSLNALIVWALYRNALKHECRRWNCRVSFRGLRSETRLLFGMSAPASLSGFLASGAIWFSTLMLSKIAGGFGQVAIFSAANSLRIMVMFLPSILLRVLMPRLNAMRATGDSVRYRKAFRVFVLTTAGLAIVIGLVLVSMSHRFLSLFGKDFADPDETVPVLLVASVFEAISGSLSQALIINSRMWQQLLNMGIWSVVLVATTHFTVHSGAIGLAKANLVAWTVALSLYLYTTCYAPVAKGGGQEVCPQ